MIRRDWAAVLIWNNEVAMGKLFRFLPLAASESEQAVGRSDRQTVTGHEKGRAEGGERTRRRGGGDLADTAECAEEGEMERMTCCSRGMCTEIAVGARRRAARRHYLLTKLPNNGITFRVSLKENKIWRKRNGIRCDSSKNWNSWKKEYFRHKTQNFEMWN